MATQEYFISLVEKSRALWDNRHKDYRNIELKSVLWDDIAKSCALATGSEAEKLFISFRTKYIRRKNEEKNNGDGRLLKKWDLQSQLKFLDGTLKSRRKMTNLLIQKQELPEKLSYESTEDSCYEDAYASPSGNGLCSESEFVDMSQYTAVDSPPLLNSRPSSPMSLKPVQTRKRRNELTEDVVDKLLTAMSAPVDVREVAASTDDGWDVSGEIKSYCMFLSYRLQNLSKTKLHKFEQVVINVLNDLEYKDE